MQIKTSNLVENIINKFGMAYALCRDVEIFVNYDIMVLLIISIHHIEYYVLSIYQGLVYSLVTINLQSALVFAHCFLSVTV